MRKKLTTPFFLLFSVLMLLCGKLTAQEVYKFTQENREMENNKSFADPLRRNGGKKIPEITSFGLQLPTVTDNRTRGYKSIIRGSVTYADNWGGNPKEGIYSFLPESNLTLNPAHLDNRLAAYSGFYHDGEYHVIARLEVEPKVYRGFYRVFDVNTWQQVKVYSDKPIDPIMAPSDLTYDPVSKKVYGLLYDPDEEAYSILCTFNLETVEITPIGSLSTPFMAIAANAEGILYGIARNGNLYRINKTNASITLLGDLGTGELPQEHQSAAFDNITGKIYWTPFLGGGKSYLYEISLDNGSPTATRIGEFPNKQQVTALSVMEPVAPLDAPDNVTNLTLNLTSPGALTGKVKFKLPTLTYLGQPLTVNLAAKIEVDGMQPLNISNLSPGQDYESSSITFQKGMREITVSVSNSAGKSPDTKISLWVGPDIPVAVGTVTLSKNAAGLPLIQWTAPTESKNDGYLDQSSLKYRIVRNPNAVEIANNITAIQFVDNTIGESLGTYSYTIYPISSGGEGEGKTSNEMTFNEFYTIPYNETFELASSMDNWTVTDLNGGTRWSYNNSAKAPVYERDIDRNGDDWLFSPPIQLKQGVTYSFTYSERTQSALFNESLRVTLGTSPSPETHTVILGEHEDYKRNSWLDHTVTFSVPADGKYHLGFYAFSSRMNFGVAIKNLSMDVIYEKGAPGPVTNVSVIADPQGGLSVSGKMNAPSVTHTEDPLSNISFVEIFRGEENTLVSKISNPSLGSLLQWTDTGLQTGLYTYNIVATNEFGKGMEVSKTVFVGEDVPGAVRNLTVTNIDNGDALISWDSPIIGKNGGYIDAASLKYKITRNPGNVVVKENATETTFTDTTIEAEWGSYSYTITTSTAIGEGMATTSDNTLIGPGYSIPYKEPFNGASSLDLWTIVDLNGDHKWGWDNFNRAPSYSSSYSVKANDWLISPPVKLYKDYTYKISYMARTENTTMSKIDKMKVTISNSTDPADHTTILNDHPALNGRTAVTYEATFVAPENGKFNVGFHVYSEAAQDKVIIDDLEIVLLSAAGVPAPVKDLTAIPDTQGGLSATVSFTSPSTTYNGTALSNITSIDIFRGESETPVYSFTQPEMGKLLTWTDNSATAGLNTYRVIPNNESGAGMVQSATVYVGPDQPAAVTNLKLEEKDNKPVVTWTAPTEGKNGGYLDVANLQYKIIRNAENGTDEIIENNFAGISYTDNKISTTQDYYSYTIVPISNNSEGVAATSNGLVMGAAYNAPFYESFANATAQQNPWTQECLNGGMAAWEIFAAGNLPTAEAQDKDGGLITFNSFFAPSGEVARLISPKISFSSMVNPKLTFYIWHIYNETQGRRENVQIEISVDGKTFEEVPNGLFWLSENNNGWTKHEVSLVNYAGAEKIQLGLKATSDNGFNMSLDNISITDGYANDLEAISLLAPSKIMVGSIGIFSVEIKNIGASIPSDYKVHLYKDGQLFMTEDGIEIAPNQTDYIDFNVVADLDESDISYEYYAVIDYGADEFKDNNRTETVTSMVSKPIYPLVQNLRGNDEGSNAILNWEAPSEEIHYDESLEDFEGYVPFIIENIGDWKLVDLDKSRTVGIRDIQPFPDMFSEKSFMVFNPVEATIINPSWAPYSGDQMLICLSAANGANNDWLISPELPGRSQTVSFYARSLNNNYNLERIVFHYSTTGDNVEDFTKLSEGGYIEVPAGSFTKYEFELPDGAKYFAIQCISNEAFMLMIDYITFTKVDKNLEEITLLGYNVYRDGAKITPTPINKEQTTYSDVNLDSNSYKYKVTAVYDKGESYYSNEVTVNIHVGIENDIYDNVKISSSPNLITIEGAIGKSVSIVTVEGRIIYTTIGGDKENIAVNSGVYLVKINNKTTKIVVP